ncbi:MAG: flagellin [Ponticaulis sp.]|nr:flagellin [Ponticaulis sp.]
MGRKPSTGIKNISGERKDQKGARWFMSIGVNYNSSAMRALMQLNRSGRDLEEIQSRMNSGLKVDSAKDNGAIFGMAQTLRSDIASLGVVTESLGHGISVTDVAYSAMESMTDLMLEMKEKALAAADPSLDSRSRAILNEDFEVLRNKIDVMVGNAEFNGINLLNGTTNGVSPITDVHGGQAVTVNDYDVKLGGADTQMTPSMKIDPFSDAKDSLSRIEQSLQDHALALNHFGGRVRTMETMRVLAVHTSDILEKNLGSLVDADLGRESAKLQAAQTRQQLSVQAMSIANQLPTFATQLFNR